MLAIKDAMLFRETDVRLGRHLLGAFSEYSSLARAVSVSIRSTRRTVLTINCCCFPCVMHLRRHWRRHFEHRLIIDSGICFIVCSVGMSSVRQVLKAVWELASHCGRGDGVWVVAILLVSALHLQFFHFLGSLLVLHLEILLKSFEAFGVE